MKNTTFIIYLGLIFIFLGSASAGFQMGLGKASSKKGAEFSQEVLKKNPNLDSSQPAEDDSSDDGDDSISTDCIVSGPSLGEGSNDNDQIFRSLEISQSNPNVLYVGTEGNGIFKSVDGGVNWTWQRKGLLCADGPPKEYPEVWDIAIHPTNSDIVYAATLSSPGPVTGDYPSAHAGIYKSTDGGNRWVRKTSGYTNSRITSIAIDPSNPDVVYAGQGGGVPSFTGTDVDGQFFSGGILKTTDAGENWSSLNLVSLSSTSEFWHMVAWSSNVLFSAGINFTDGSKASGLLRSTDAGANWTRISPTTMNVWKWDVARQDSNDLIAVVSSSFTFNTTTNGGTTWSNTFNNDVNGIVAISPFNQSIVFSADVADLVKSTNSLVTTTVVHTFGADRITHLVFHPTNANIIYAGGEGLKIYKSTDGGDSFSVIANLRTLIGS